MKKQRNTIPILSTSWNYGDKKESVGGDINKSSNITSPYQTIDRTPDK
jgi:hypothetical protein